MSDRATILVVDDTLETLQLLVDTLTREGYRARAADSGELALAATAANPPNLILLDIRLPGIDGLEVCRRLKAAEPTRHIPVILMSAYAEIKDWVKGLQHGAVDYIAKPYQQEELLARVKTHLDLSRANASNLQQAEELRQVNEQLLSEIEERKRVEAELQQIRQQLEERVRERTATLAAGRRQLEEAQAATLNLMEDLIAARDRAEAGQVALRQEVSERQAAEEKVRQNLKEKETLLKEVHHRVKNNMAVVVSLLNLQASRITDADMKQLFEESKQRIYSMALVHDKLYRSENLAIIDFNDYISSIVKALVISYQRAGRQIETQIDVKEIMLDIDTAIPCGLLINELVTNVLKYAFTEQTSGVIGLAMAKTDKTYTLTIRDNGIGLPTGFDHTKSNTLGLQLVEALCGQLGGTLEFHTGWDEGRGTEVVVTFSERENKEG